MCEGSYYYPVCQFSWQLLSRWCDDDVSGLAMLLLHQPLGPLRRPPPRHPMTNYFLFVTETQSSEGRGIFCSLSHQPNLTLFPPVGHSLTGSLFLSSLIGDIGRQWGQLFYFFCGVLVCKTVTCRSHRSSSRTSRGGVHVDGQLSLTTCCGLHINTT